MIKKIAFISLASVLFVACANKDVKLNKKQNLDLQLKLMVGDDMNYTKLDSKSEDELLKTLLTNSASFAQSNRQGAVKENMTKLPNKMPLFRQPLFAQMVVFPYISDNGVYHGYSEHWVKIKDGEFVLTDPRSNQDPSERIFDVNEVGEVR